MKISKFGGRLFTIAAASVFAIAITASTPDEAQAASKTGNFLLGGLAGAAGLAVIHGLNKNRRYRQRGYYEPAYAPRRRYYRAPARRYYAPAAWSPAWYRYCGNKYRSFNPNTGYYKPYSGGYRFCR